MKQWSTVVRNPTGLHARPAKIFVNAAKQFKCDIRVQHGAKSANAKSLISMLTLGAERGADIMITVNGEDEETALTTLQDLMASGLGEGDLLERVEAERLAAQQPAAAPPAGAGAPAAAPEPQVVQPATTSATAMAEAGAPAAANVLQGIAASPGIAIGPVFQYAPGAVTVDETSAGASVEQNRLKEAVAQADEQLRVVANRMASGGARGEAAIFDVHRELLDDPELLEVAVAHIQEGMSAAKAWQTVTSARADLLSQLSDPVLAGRSADLRDVRDRVLHLLAGTTAKAGIKLPDHPVILVAPDLRPSDTA
jgi:phosphotransferase system HPr (HPr) family protein